MISSPWLWVLLGALCLALVALIVVLLRHRGEDGAKESRLRGALALVKAELARLEPDQMDPKVAPVYADAVKRAEQLQLELDILEIKWHRPRGLEYWLSLFRWLLFVAYVVPVFQFLGTGR
jgi:hypothetical protein